MSLLFDENLSRKLVGRLEDLFANSTHVAFEGLLQARDEVVWQHAKASGCTIVTADSDFAALVKSLGPPPQVIWLKDCRYSTAVAERLLRSQAIRIAEFLKHPEQALLTLTL